MDRQRSIKAWKWQVICYFFLCSWGWVTGQLRYSVLEETKPGTLIGNVAQNLGLNLADINKRRLGLESEESSRYFSVNKENGDLTVEGRIDREVVCASSSSCLLHLELVAENPLELFGLKIEILDINDNSPSFAVPNQEIRITELLAVPGAQFSLEIAQDPDVGINGVTHYRLNPNPYFSLSVTNRKDGTLIPELILEKVLDREEKKEHKLILTAVDGGEQARSGSTQVTIIVLDINDNAPVFAQSCYKISLLENLPLNTIVIKLNATDLDEGSNGEIVYLFNHHNLDAAKRIFGLNAHTGEIFIKGGIDFEESSFFELSVRAIDKGVPELEGRCLVQIEIEDENDNTPDVLITSKTNEVPENAPIGTVVGFITVKDRDSGKNGEITLEVSPDLPFKCQPFNNRYSLVTAGYLDREKVSKYVIKVIASDLGSPPLHNQTIVTIYVSDVNDNPPTFLQSVYNAFTKENNEPGSLLCTVSASDPDEGGNAKLKYSIIESQIDGSSASSFVYINSDNGNIYAQRSFDYEQFQVLQITTRVEDSGFPSLFSNVSVFIFIWDTNDNYPTVLNPDNSGEFINQEKIPLSASVGYLVTKVSAVDLDSGHNAWLAYTLSEHSGGSLFQISEYTGEIRTIRAIQENDNTEQQLVISVRDHGEPPLTTTVKIFINILDTIEKESQTSQDFLTNSNPTPNLTLYLIISLVAISLVSLVTFIILIIKCFKNGYYDNSCGFSFLNKSPPKNYLDQYQPTLYLNTDGTLKYMEVRMAPPEPQGQCYPACFPSVATSNITLTKPSNTPNFTDVMKEPTSDLLKDQYQAQPNTEWRFSQAQRPGPSGAQPTEEAGVWPNNQFETERLQAMILASANEAAEGTSGLGGGTGTMGLSARYGPQFTLQHVPDYRQNVYIPGSTLTPTNAAGKRDGKSGGNKKKSGKKEKK
ncbi:protocadherin gamma-C5-like isoform X18 [Spea bombifrons]|uniref:protocadherin gamma-C5-like isoform X18 n=1 Tax=Spea bombifrons TaxID=233779 RepID=UPI0023492953|nr:protocadherin gamma-C5-like isoform X18 [Spea bombifrons]